VVKTISVQNSVTVWEVNVKLEYNQGPRSKSAAITA